MTKKVRCTITGNIIYVTQKRYAKMVAKYGSEENLHKKYVSLVGRRVQEGQLELPNSFKNRIKCTITGKYCYITNERIQAGIKKYGSWEELCKHYICREAARLLKAGKTVKEIQNQAKNS